MRRLVLLLSLAPLLGGCLALTAVDAVVEAVDRRFSQRTGEECSALNLALGEDYCQSRPESARPALYCFRTLGGVDCHTDRDPYRVAETGRTVPAPALATPR